MVKLHIIINIELFANKLGYVSVTGLNQLELAASVSQSGPLSAVSIVGFPLVSGAVTVRGFPNPTWAQLYDVKGDKSSATSV